VVLGQEARSFHIASDPKIVDTDVQGIAEVLIIDILVSARDTFSVFGSEAGLDCQPSS
jgi:hypothetical protein